MTNILHGIIIPIILIVGPVLGYIPQYKEIQRTRNHRAFSPLVILILLISNILRIFFWIERRFEVALLIQSIVMIVAQLLLLELMVRLKSQDIEQSYTASYTVFGHSLGEFWIWNDIKRYINFLVTFSGCVGTLTLINILVIKSAIYRETLGTFALLIEATLAVPQLYQNYRTKSTRGLRTELVAAWAIGDAGKTVLFIARKSPIQFLVCGIVQLIVDFGIFYQMGLYGNNSSYINEEHHIMASAAVEPDVAKTPKSPARSLAKSLDEFDLEEGGRSGPMRSKSTRERSPSSFYRTM